MKPPSERQAASEIIDVLADLLGCAPKAVSTRKAKSNEADHWITVNGYQFVVEYKTTASAGPLSVAVEQLKRSSKAFPHGAQPLLVVPFMGDVGREICEKSRVSWIDLSGNAKIVAPGLRIWIEGRPNKYRDRGRPPNVFAPKSSRVARQLLFHPHRFQSQAELARETALDDGYVSKIVRRLEQESYVDVNDEGALRPRDANLLLEAWHGAYNFDRHRILKGHMPARTGEELLRRISTALADAKSEYAATGLAAAWLYTKYAAFRLVTVYLPSIPSRSFLKSIEFSDEPKGANLWLVLPDDEGVFHGSQQQDGIRCVSSVQTYLDLKAQPERAKDAAVEFRKKLLTWSQRGK